MNYPLKRALKKGLCALELPQPREACIRATVSHCQRAYQSRRRRKRLGSWELICGQIRFIAAPVWGVQMALFLCLLIMMLSLPSEAAVTRLPFLLRFAAILIAMTVLPFYGRARRYRMAEIEHAARQSQGKLLLSKLAAVGTGDVACLTGLTLASVGKVQEAWGIILACAVLPFLLTATGLLLIFNHTKEDSALAAALSFGVALAAVFWMLPPGRYAPLLLDVTASAALLALLGWECRRFLQRAAAMENRQKEKGVGKWNWN